MNTGTKLAIAGVGTAVLVVIIYAVMKSSRNSAAVVQQQPMVTPEVPVANYSGKNNIDVSGISKPATTNANTVTQPPSATYNPPPIPGGIGYYKNKPQMIARD